jgi:hypothetical protein
MAIDPNNITTVNVGALPPSVWSLPDLLPHEVSGLLKRGNVQGLADLISDYIGTASSLAFNPTTVADGETLPGTSSNEWLLVGKGTFNNVGGALPITTTEELNALTSNGSFWSLAVEIPINVELAGIVQTIRSGFTTTTPSENAVYEALILKADLSGIPTGTDDLINNSTVSGASASDALNTLNAGKESTVNFNDLLTLKANITKVVNSTVAKVIWAPFGDSMAQTKSQFLFPYISKYIGQAGVIGFGNYRGVTINSGTTTTEQDYTLFPFTMTKILSGNFGVFGLTSLNPTADKWKVYYINNGATFKVQIDDIDNTTVTTTSDGSLGVLTITTTLAQHKFSVNCLTGNLLIPTLGFYTSTVSGLIPVYLSEGGNDMSSWIDNALPLNNLFAIYTDIGVNVFSYEMKETVLGLQARITKLFDKLQASIPNSDILIYTTTPVVSDTDNTQEANNTILRKESLSRKFSLFDCFRKIGTYENLVKEGWEGDGTHPTSPANKYLANEVIQQFNLGDFFKVTSLESRKELINADKFTSFTGLEIYSDATSLDGNIRVPRKLFFRNVNGTKTFSIDLGDGTNGSDGSTSVLPDYIQFGANNHKIRGTTTELWINQPTGGGATLGNLKLGRISVTDVISPGDLTFTNVGGNAYAKFMTSGRIILQNAGTFTDNGVDRLQVTGTISASAATTSGQVVIKSQLDLKADLASPVLTGTPTAPTATAGTNTTQLATTAFVQAATRPYKSYVALISQSGTAAPTVVVLENQLSGPIVWTRTGAGQYTGTLTGAFTSNKTACLNNLTSSGFIGLKQTTVNTVTLSTGDLTNTASDGLLTQNTIKIEVYP